MIWEIVMVWIASTAVAVAALVAVGHAVIYKRDPRSATIWVLTITFLPLLGTFLYVLFGINRYKRRARRQSRDDELDLLSPGVGEAPPDLPEPLGGLAQLVGHVTGLPLTRGNRIAPLYDGVQAYPEMLAAIRDARHSIALTSYILDGRGIGQSFIRALRQAHARGVRVRILVDDVYARLSPWSAYLPLRRAGVPIAAFNPTLIPARLYATNLRNHRKILIVDGDIGFTGGMNIFSPYWRPEAPQEACHDLHFRVEGPVVTHLKQAFIHDWFDTTGEILDAAYWGADPQPCADDVKGWARGIEAGPDEAMDRIRWTFMGALATARHSVRIWTPYFVPDPPIVEALSTAALRGVKIDLLTPANSDHPTVQWAARAHYWRVLEHGARIFERPGPFDHTKLMLVDGQWTCLGSANWDARSLRLNFEFNLEVYDSDLCTALEAIFDAVRDASHPLTADVLHARPLAVKLRDGAARLFTPLL